MGWLLVVKDVHYADCVLFKEIIGRIAHMHEVKMHSNYLVKLESQHKHLKR